MQTMGYTPEDAVKDIIQPGSLERSNHSKIKNSNCVEGLMAEAKKKPAKWHEAIKRPVKVGDKVHVGHAQKGGAGVEGKVTKIAGNVVYIKNDAGKTYKGPLKNTAIMEISGVDSLKPNDPHTPEDEAEKDDMIIETENVNILIDSESAPLINGSTVDYVDGLMRSGFVISNPNTPATGGCACGGGGCGCGGDSKPPVDPASMDHTQGNASNGGCGSGGCGCGSA